MKEKRIKEIREKLAVFSFPRLQELLTLSSLLEKESIPLEEVREFISSYLELQETRRVVFEKINKEKERKWNKNTRRCPLCKMPLSFRPITVPKGKGNVNGYTCLWYCQEENCNFEEYTYEDFKEVYTKIMGG